MNGNGLKSRTELKNSCDKEEEYQRPVADHFACTSSSSLLMLYGELLRVTQSTHTHTHTQCGQKVEFCNGKRGGTIVTTGV